MTEDEALDDPCASPCLPCLDSPKIRSLSMEQPMAMGVWGKVGRGAQGCGLVGDIGDRGTTAPDDLGGLCQP